MPHLQVTIILDKAEADILLPYLLWKCQCSMLESSQQDLDCVSHLSRESSSVEC